MGLELAVDLGGLLRWYKLAPLVVRWARLWAWVRAYYELLAQGQGRGREQGQEQEVPEPRGLDLRPRPHPHPLSHVERAG
jgi:hypothetical protein